MYSGTSDKESACQRRAWDTRNEGSVSEAGRSLRVGNGNPLQYSCLKTSTDRGAWWAVVHGVTKSRMQLSTHAYCLSQVNSKLFERVFFALCCSWSLGQYFYLHVYLCFNILSFFLPLCSFTDIDWVPTIYFHALVCIGYWQWKTA